MKVFSVFISLFFLLISVANAQPVTSSEKENVYYETLPYQGQNVQYVEYNQAPNKKMEALDIIKHRGVVRCGSNLQVKSFAVQKDGAWQGIDADFCRVIALAVLGDNSKIEIVDVKPNEIVAALNSFKIDIMLSGAPYSAAMETSHQALSAGLLYYDHQLLMTSTDLGDKPDDLRGKKICLSTDTDYYKNFDDYNMRYNLNVKYLSFANLEKAKEAFLLKRCDMISASGLLLNGVLLDLPTAKAKILPIHIALHPVYAFVQKDNNELRLAVKWIINALMLAEQYGITVQNREFFAANDNQEIRNLLGDDPKMWQSLGLKPNWVREAIALIGNYADIYDKNLGKDSNYKLKRREGRLVKDGGTVYPIPFM